MRDLKWFSIIARLLAIGLVVCVVVVACGRGCASPDSKEGGKVAKVSEEAESAETEEAKAKEEPPLPFESRDPRDAKELDAFVEEAIKRGKEAQKKLDKDAKEDELSKSVQSTFSSGNASYRKGNYSDAFTDYMNVLDEYPLHLGANVNLTLALLQCNREGDAEDALRQALMCCYLFPEDAGCIINAQVAGIACGFKADDIADAIDALRKEAPDAKGDIYDVLSKNKDLHNSYGYNLIWDDIETRLNEDAGRRTYKDLQDLLETLDGQFKSGDEDLDHLKAYADALGVRLGYVDDEGNVVRPEPEDPTTIDATNKLPYAVADDDICSIVFDEVTTDKDGFAYAAYKVTNYTDEDIKIVVPDEWKVNGTVTIQPYLKKDNVFVELKKGETVSGKLQFAGVGKLKGEAKSFVGELAVFSVRGEGEIARYPVSYAAE